LDEQDIAPCEIPLVQSCLLLCSEALQGSGQYLEAEFFGIMKGIQAHARFRVVLDTGFRDRGPMEPFYQY
jgi:hypothetical protein